MNKIKVYNENEKEYKQLQKFVDYLNSINPDRFNFYLEDILFDAGSNWMYTAIITKDKLEGMEWQTCTPAVYTGILNVELDDKDINQKYAELYNEITSKTTLYNPIIDEKFKQIIITPEEQLLLEDYKGYESLSKSVGGCIEYCGQQNFKLFAKNLNVDIVCNDSFLIDDNKKFNKINAVASMLCGTEIRGNVVLVINDGNGDNRGFEYYSEDGVEAITETWEVEDLLLRCIRSKEWQQEIKRLHEVYDNNKSEPKFIVLDSLDEEIEERD